MRRNILYLVICLCLASCANGSQIESTVTRFHHPRLTAADKSFLFLPDANQRDGLEYNRYATMIAEELTQLGMRQLSAPPADYGISFTYGADESTLIIENRPYHLDTGYGWSGSHWGWGIGGPLYPPHYATGRTLFHSHHFSLQLRDLKTPGKPVLFEGKASGTGANREFLTISRCLIHALFVGFPGEDGESVTVALPANSCINSADAPETDSPANQK